MPSRSSPGLHAHDHRRCIGSALDAAEQLCSARRLRLTPIRRRVLELVWASHDPIGAYDILAKLPRGADRATAPMTVYRALDFLVEHGLVHRLDSLNAYIGCDHVLQPHVGQLFVCRECGRVTELDDPALGAAFTAAAESIGFSRADALEIKGRCRDCRLGPGLPSS